MNGRELPEGEGKMAKKLGFGFMRLPLLKDEEPASIDYPALETLVDAFLARGFTYFDTAPTYHAGHSEEALRRVLAERYPRGAFTLASKMPPWRLEGPEHPARLFARQLERCGVEYFDYYLAHSINREHYAQAKEYGVFEFIAQKKREGKILRAGLSFHDTPEFLDQVLTEHPELDFVQLQINYLDWNSPAVQARRCYEIARAHAKPIFVMEPCKGGRLAKLPPEAQALLNTRAPGTPAAGWAFRFAAGLEGVEMVLSGMNTLEQVLENTAVLKAPFPLKKEEQALLEQAARLLRQSELVACTGCGYCAEGCPAGIPIPQVLELYNQALPSGAPTAGQAAAYAALPGAKAAQCVGCKKCETVCPQRLPVAARMRQTAALFGQTGA